LREDLERIDVLVAEVGRDIEFTIDGNQNMTMASSLLILEELDRRRLYPKFFEQPLRDDDWAGFIELKKRCPIPICADELVKSHADAQRVVNDGAADLINLKITKSGVFETLRIIEVARKHHIDLMVGGMIETDVAMTFSLHLAAACPQIKYYDLDTPFFFAAQATKESPYGMGRAVLRCPEGPGLGLTLFD
jgi:L-alanine-DL-glutamate epimerase-like enolase superfamily enzyme